MNPTIPQVAETMKTVLTDVAEGVARVTGFVQRRSKMGGAEFVQSLVFGWLGNPAATLEELTQTAAVLGVEISPQGLEQRFTPAAAECVRHVLEGAVGQLLKAEAVAVPILRRFAGVYVQDSTVVNLPEELAAVWQGCGGSAGHSPAAVKVEVRLNLTDGGLAGPFLENGRVHDRALLRQGQPLPAGALRLTDLGYWSLAEMEEQAAAGVYWLSRLQPQTAVFTPDGRRWELLDLLERQGSTTVDLQVQLGIKQRVPARLLAVQVPQEVADQRRRRLKEEARRRQQPLSKMALTLVDWTILVTNIPVDKLTGREAFVLIRVRWQIELLFKLWKSHGKIDEWRSQKPWRILCEVYAKLLAVLIQHWLLLTGCWQYPNRSLTKAAQTVRKQALHLASTLEHMGELTKTIEVISRCLAAGCRINKRKIAPHTYQLLLDLVPEDLA